MTEAFVRKQRRPIGHRVEPDGPDPETPIRTFLFLEDAQAAPIPHGWTRYEQRVQYVGAWMRWVVLYRRVSWRHSQEEALCDDGSLIDFWGV